MPALIILAALVTSAVASLAWTLRGISRAVNDFFGGTP